MDELVQFLRDRYDDEERIARRAGDSFRQIGETGVIVATEGDRAEECASANWAGVAEHIVEHDPARVLRDIEARRELLSRYEAMASGVLVMTGVNSILAEYRRVILPSLAAAYVDHPGFRAEWRP